MKRVFVTFASALLLFTAIGCYCGNWDRGAHRYAGLSDESIAGPTGPPTGTYGYPYYTVRAPRDFLVDKPPSIGQ